MRIVIDIDGRYERTPDGAVWVKSGATYAYWTRFLEVFDSIRLVSRIKDVSSVPDGMLRVDGKKVSFFGVPYYAGPWQYALRASAIKNAVQGAFEYGDAVALSSGPISISLGSVLTQRRYPYLIHVIGDPSLTFAPGASPHPGRPFFRWWLSRRLRHLAHNAYAAWYVTDEALQKSYPCPGVQVGVSDVDLPEEAFVPEPRQAHSFKVPIKIVMVGTLAQLHKAPHVLIDAVASCTRSGLDLTLSFVGDGKYRDQLEHQAKSLRIGDRVLFHGQLQTPVIRHQLDQSDLFVLPSFGEGLPRAVIEAMARALPCIGSTVCGIPQLLPREDMVPAGDRHALARKITEVVTDPERMARMSARNLSTAHSYRRDVLHRRWIEFYRSAREWMEQWLKNADR
jgi:glycosyltransferase involved in cell wall biosynthesis